MPYYHKLSVANADIRAVSLMLRQLLKVMILISAHPVAKQRLKKLADLMGVEPKPLDAAHGEEDVKKVAFIREDECIGCTKCIQACPVDAILGAAKHMHTVITDECTGCDLCVDPCPVDCIDMVPIAQTTSTWKWDFESSPKGDIPIKMVS